MTNNQGLNLTDISAISPDVSRMDIGDADKHFELDRNPHYQMVSNFGSSIVMSREKSLTHFECPPNVNSLLYDEAVAEITKHSKDIALSEVQSLKFHANTWGLSSCNSFADNVMSKMAKIEHIDFSDTVKYRHRSDLCMSVRAILAQASNKKVTKLNLRDNDLEEDGARAFVDFLKENKTLEFLDITNCNLGDKSAIMMQEALASSPKIKLKELLLGNNTFTLEGIEAISKIVEN